VLRLWDGTRKSDKLSVTHSNLHSTNHKLVSSLSKAPLVLGQDMGDSGLTRLTTARTYIVYSITFHGGHIQMAFCPETRKWESRNSHSWDSRDFEGA
jgi:hypothetical protein